MTIGYARVSSQDQLSDLTRQVSILEVYCATKGWACEIVQDRGSGLNYRKWDLRQLTHQDRLVHFGAELVFTLCEQFEIEVVIINAAEERTLEEDLVQDVVEIITVFSARLYGSRSHQNKQMMQHLKEVVNEISGQNPAHGE